MSATNYVCPKVKLQIHYISDEVKELYQKYGGIKTKESVGFDLVTVEDTPISHNEFKLINLGIIARPCYDNYYIQVVPRSSTYKKYGLLQANSIGIIDNDYCGSNDIIRMPVVNMESYTVIKKGTPIAQLLIVPKVVIPEVIEFTPEDTSRGGFGSTDAKLSIQG